VARRGARPGLGADDGDGADAAADAAADAVASVRFSSRRGGQHFIAMSSARGVGVASLSTDMVELRASMLRGARALATRSASRAAAPLAAGVPCDLSVWILECPGLVVGRGARRSDGSGDDDSDGGGGSAWAAWGDGDAASEDALSEGGRSAASARSRARGGDGAGAPPTCVLWSPDPRNLELRVLALRPGRAGDAQSAAAHGADGGGPGAAPGGGFGLAAGAPRALRHRRAVRYALDAPCTAFCVARRAASAAAPSRAYVLAHTARGTLLVYAAQTGRLCAVVPVSPPTSPSAFSCCADPSGALVALCFGAADGSAGDGRCVTVVAINSGRKVCVLPAPPVSRNRATVQFFAAWVAPADAAAGDAPRLATAGCGSSIVHWDVVSRHRWQKLRASSTGPIEIGDVDADA